MSLKKEFEYFLANKETLNKQYGGKYIVIKNQEIIGVFDSEIDAVEQTSQKEQMGTFLVQKCDPRGNSFTQTYHSKAIFA